MNFDEWINLTPDDEKDTLCLFDAWRAGGSAMLERLVEGGWIDKDFESLIKFAPPFREFLEDKE